MILHYRDLFHVKFDGPIEKCSLVVRSFNPITWRQSALESLPFGGGSGGQQSLHM